MKQSHDTERLARRLLLDTASNPAARQESLISWSGRLTDGRGLSLEYVPDRRILSPTAFAAYLKALDATDWPTLEALVSTMLDDINNELVPRWVRVTGNQEGTVAHKVSLRDSQPGWDGNAIVPPG